MALKVDAYKEGIINFMYASHLCLLIEKNMRIMRDFSSSLAWFLGNGSNNGML